MHGATIKITILDSWSQISVITRKQTPSPQSNSKTSMDLWNLTVGNCIELKYLELLERFQSKVLRIITDAPWYIPNTIIKRDLQIATVKKEARKYSANYQKRLDAHPNNPANALFKEQLENRRLKRLYAAELVTNG